MNTMELEFHQLDLRYRDLRVFDPAGESRLLVSLSQSGQRVPVLVVDGVEGRYVLIDGYRRVSALGKLGRDTVSAMVLSLPEPEALLFSYRLERSGRRSALEEGWLLKELASVHGMEALYTAWRRGDGIVRDRIVSLPLLYLSSCEEIKRPDPPVPDSPADALRRDIAAICRRVRMRLLRRERDAEIAEPFELSRTWADTRGAFTDLCAVMEECLAGC